MYRYTAVLKAPDSDQRRYVGGLALDEQAARVEIAAREAELVAYNFDTDFHRIEGADPDTPDANVVLGLQPGEAEAVLRDYRFDDAGRVQYVGKGVDLGTLTARLRGKFALHHQTAPYEIESLELVSPDRERINALVREARRLAQTPDEWLKVLDEMRAAGIPINAVTATLYGVPLKNMFGGASVWDWDTSVIQTSLHTAYTSDLDTHDFFNDASGTEVTGTNYVANGFTHTCSAPTYDTASDQIRLDANDASWATSTISATDSVTWQNTAGATSTDPLIATVDFGGTVSTTAGTFQITWDATGVVVFDIT